jgi:hypothetical protein
MSASLLSVNGKLRSLYDSASVNEDRAYGYKQVEIAQPLVVRYLYFFLKHKGQETQNELMISTFVKATETKEGAAEAINYFEKEAKFDKNDQLRIKDFGAERYGHPLCYYTKSYLGESLYLTTKIMELDKVDSKVVNAIQRGIGKVSSMPAFAAFLPYAAGASVGVSLFQKLIDLFNEDDAIVAGHDLDLHFDLENVRHLQSGRIVCINEKEESDFLSGGKYELSQDNRLIDMTTGNEYNKSSYFVIQIDSKPNKKLETFDYFFGASDLLKQTNRGGDPAEIVTTIVNLFRGYQDLVAIREIEDLSIDADDENIKKKIRAWHKSMSRDIRSLYLARVKELTGG